MTAEDPNAAPAWSDVRALFEACLELPAAERPACLAAAPARLRGEVEALLTEIETRPGSLDPELGHRSLVASAESLLTVGRSIGAYRIRRVLGHGGMSTVYLAEQENPRRHVALKLLTATLSSPESIQRFTNEAELLARLQHPGIAQIHAVDVHTQHTEGGELRWPFFAMEYVDGARTLMAWAGERHRSDLQRLELFLQIGAAVQHAHERGVVHRDLKPQNILVDANDRAKVIDFGIARSIVASQRNAGLTQPGDVLGTLHYMSPEQVQRNAVIDTRTDVHALGIVLFELLTGRLPFDFTDQSLPEVGRILTEVPATPLRSLQPEADQDLELILGKALSKDPAQRYSTAGAMAEDVRRFLDHEPINARQPSLRYQLRMFARRRRGLVAAVLAVVLVSTIGGISSFVYAIRAHDAEERAKAETSVKTDALRRTFDLALRTVIDLPQRLEGMPRATEVRRAMLAEAKSQLEFVEANLELDVAMQHSLARAYFQLGESQVADSGQPDGNSGDAGTSFARAESYVLRVLEHDPDDVRALFVRLDLALRRGTVAFNRRRDVDTATAQWNIVKAMIDRLEKLPPVEGRDLRRDRASYEFCLGLLAMMERDHLSEMKHIRRSREMILEAAAGPPYDVATCDRLARICMQLALTVERVESYGDACPIYAEAAGYLAIAEDHPDDVELRHMRAKVRNRYGYALAADGAMEKGDRELTWSWKELVFLHETDPNQARIASSLALASANRSEHLLVRATRCAEPEPARELYIEAKQVAERGLAVAEQLIEKARDMQSIYVAGECRRVIVSCDDALQ